MLLVLLVGAMLSAEYIPRQAIWFVPLLLLVIRPVAVLLGVVGSPVTPIQRRMMCWFGIRGIGSLFYLAYVITYGAGKDYPPAIKLLCGLTLTTVATSVVVHGISVTPLMGLYHRVRRPRGKPETP